MEYTVQKGDTIADVTRLLGTDWSTLKKMNPSSIGRSQKNNNWFLREGKTVSVGTPFQQILAEQTKVAATEINNTKAAEPGGAEARGDERRHIVQPGDTVWQLAVKRYRVNPDEILRLNNIKDPRQLQVGTELRIPRAEKSGVRQVVASWYGENFHGRPMANGEPYNMYGNTIAHKEMPLGTRVELLNPETGRKVQAVVADRGPYIKGREVDLSYNLARQLSLVDQGVGSLVMTVL